MSYIGNKPATNFETVRKQVSTTNSGTTITLDFAVSSVQDILVTVNAVVQSYDNYSVSGTTLTLGGTLNNDRVEILYVGRTFQTVTPAIGTVTNDMLAGSIANSKLANSSITLNGSAVSLGGSATVDNTPNFLAYRSSSDQSISNNTYTKVQFNSESYDTDNAFDSSTNFRFVVPSGKQGKYSLYTNVWMRGTDVDKMNYYLLAFYKNGSNVWEQHSNFMNNDIRSFGANMSLTLNLSAGDYIEVYGRININSGSPSFGNDAMSGVPTTWFQGIKIA